MDALLLYNKYIMASINAKRAAVKVSESIRLGKKVVLGNILQEVGYSKQTSLKPKLVTGTKTFQKAMTDLLKDLDNEIERIKQAMLTKDLSEERYDVLEKALDRMIKNQQLLSGGDTERIGLNIKISEEIAKKNDIG